MLIRMAVAASDKEREEKLILKLTGISIVLKTEFDIAVYSDSFDKLAENIKNIDIFISDFAFLHRHSERLSQLYLNNSRCLPVLIGEDREELGRYLIIRPVQLVESVDSITPEDENDKIKKVCSYFEQIINNQLENRTDNSVLYITTKYDSFAVSKDSILYCQSDLKYTVFVIDNGMFIRKLDKLQTIEEKYLWDFRRVHQSFLVNPKKVKSIDKSSNEIILEDGTRIPYSRKYASAVRDLFNY